MKGKSIAEAVRELENLRDEGFLGEDQFKREVQDLLDGKHDQEPEVETIQSQKQDFIAPTTPAEEETSGKGPGRVIIRGHAPWDDKSVERVRLGKEEDPDETLRVGSAKRALNAIQREELAQMAQKTIRSITKRRDPNIAFLISFILPGLGHAYYGEQALGVLLMLVGGACWVGIALQEWWVLYFFLPLGLLSGALAHRSVDRRNRQLEEQDRLKEHRKVRAKQLNVEKSIRQTGKNTAGPKPS